MKTTLGQQGVRHALKRIFSSLACAVVATFWPHQAAGQVLLVDLGSASSFAVLAGSGVSNAGMTSIWGDVGSSPTATTAGFGTVTLYGTNHGGDATTVQAKAALSAAYDDAEARTPTTIFGAIYDLGGDTLTSGVYNNPSSFGINGTLTLDAQGDPNAVWIFQAGSTLTTSVSSAVVLIGGAQASNVFWQVGSSATLGADTAFVGNLLVFTSISLDTGTVVEGRVLAQNGAVTLVENMIIPEPNRWLLFGSGFILLLTWRWRSVGRRCGTRPREKKPSTR